LEKFPARKRREFFCKPLEMPRELIPIPLNLHRF